LNMSKILVKSSSGIMGGSDTRIYNPRSESSHMYRNNHEEEDKYGRESSEARDERYDRKLRIKEKKNKEKNKIKHIKMSAEDLMGIEDEKEEAEEGDKFDTDRELSAQTGPAGNMGFLTSLAAQAKGPGAAGGSAFAMGEPMEIAYQLLKSKELSEKTKKKKRERRKTKEERQKWRPSTGQFKTPPGGSLGPKGATGRRAKGQMRSVKRGKLRGLMHAPLSVEMEHRGVATKQPKSKDVPKYKEFLGQQESRKRAGNVRSPTSQQSRSGARSYYAGKTGGGRLQGMSAPKPRLKPHRLPPITPPSTLKVPHLNQPQMSGPGATGYMPMQKPISPTPMPMDAMSQPSMMVAKGAFGLTTIELGKILRIAERTLRAKEKKKKSTGNAETIDADQTPTGQTTKPQGGTEDHRMENIGGVKGLRGNTQ
jgi:hypothetical protein